MNTTAAALLLVIAFAFVSGVGIGIWAIARPLLNKRRVRRMRRTLNAPQGRHPYDMWGDEHHQRL